MTTVPVDWCPGLPPAERIARLLLDQRSPDLCFHLVDPDLVRAGLARRWPGHILPDVIVRRQQLLDEQTALVRTALGYLVDATGLALVALEART
jgi:hypothetical protein